MGSWLFGKAGAQNETPQPASSMRIQTSVQGRARPLIWGQGRVSPNLIWYGDFYSVAIQQSQQGGKGGSSGGGGKGQQGAVTYDYYTSVAMGLCEGPIAEVLTTWNNKAQGTAASFGFTTFVGSYVQTPWGYLSTSFPDEALAYRGLAYLAQAGLSLGQTTELPNYSLEVRSPFSNAIAGAPDANAKDVVVDYLTNENYGVGFPSARLDTVMTLFSNYSLATGMVVSPVLIEPREAREFLSELLSGLNSTFRWNGTLTVIPWGTEEITANGVTYTPNVTPEYDLTEDDFLAEEGEPPIQARRRRRSDMINDVKVEYLSRANDYDPAAIDAKDQAAIDAYGLRSSSAYNFHFFALAEAAELSAHLILNREQIPNTYQFRLPPRFILLDPEDIVTLSRPSMGLDRQPVRITDIKENEDGSLSFSAEEYLGTASAPRYGSQANSGHVTNTNADPGSINEPIIFEPTAELGGGLYVWAAVSGVDTALWGGCNVYASYDGVTYTYLDVVRGPARMGVLSDPLPSVPVNPIGQTIDTTNTLAVDLAMSASELIGGTTQDATGLNTACYVDGEIIAYRDAALTAAYNYDLTYLVRGAYGTESAIASDAFAPTDIFAAPDVFTTGHLAGKPFARLDQGILKVPYDQARIGQTIYLKFQSFNIWGGGLQDISALPAYPYVLTGSALATPLAVPTNLRVVFEAGFTKIWWDEVADFRNGVRYVIKKGTTYSGAQQVADQAHPPFIAFGEGTYWITAYVQPVPGLQVYSEDPASITIAGNMLIANLVATIDFQALGWPGTFDDTGKEGADPDALLRLTSAANILENPDVLGTPDVLNAGGVNLNGSWTADPSTWVDVLYPAQCAVNATWLTAGIPVGQDILSIDDILNTPDILASSSTQYVQAWVEISIATEVSNDVFSGDDVFAEGDVFTSGIEWGSWQRFVPGVYYARFIRFRAVLETVDATIISYMLSFTAEISLPPRIDHYLNNTVPGAGLTITFEPDNSDQPAPFNGGPAVGGVHNHPLPYVSVTWPGRPDVNYVLDSLTVAAVTIHFEDGAGTPVTVDDVDVVVEGY